MPLTLQEFNTLITQDVYQQHYHFWLSQFAGLQEYTVFEEMGHAAPEQDADQQHYQLELPSSVIRTMGKLTDSEDGRFTILSAVFNLLLSKYTGKETVLIKTPLHKGSLVPTAPMFVEEVLLQTDFTDMKTLRDLILAGKKAITESYQYQQFPVDLLMDKERQLNYYHITNVFLYNPALHRYESNIDTYDLSVAMISGALSTQLSVRYNGRCYSDTFIRRFFSCYLQLLTYLDNVNIPLEGMRIQQEDAYQSTLQSLAYGAVTAWPGEQLLPARFAEVARQYADRTALVAGRQRYTYRELNAQSAGLAMLLQQQYGLQAGDKVGIWLPASAHFMLSVLAVMRSGAAFVPVDPSEGIRKTAHIFNNVGVRLVITDAAGAKEEGLEGLAVMDITTLPAVIPPADINWAPVTAEDLVYVMHTSGTEGVSKGVEITHGNMFNYLSWACSFYFSDCRPDMALFTSPAFDLTITSMFCPLLLGGCIYAYSNLEPDTALLKIFEADSAVSAVKMTPSHIDMLQHAAPDIRTPVQLVIAGGEELGADHVRFLRQINPAIRIFNEYGPTEATVGNAIKEVTAVRSITIGRPIDNTSLFIMDRYNDLLPIGAVGEIFIGGAGVARGYMNLQELTEKKFVPNPYVSGERLYRTGDMGCFMENGEVFFLGRRDGQVKYHGHRVETGEIEYAIRKYPGIRRCVVNKIKHQEEGDILVAYIVSAERIDIAALKQHLSNYLDKAVIPAYYMPIKKIPLSLNGKVDRRALPPFVAAEQRKGGTPPASQLEKKMVAIWEDILMKKHILMEDDFFELGGHSLKAIRIIARVKKEFNVQLMLRSFFDNSTVKDVCRLIEMHAVAQYTGIPSVADQEYYPVSFSQRRFWVLEQLTEGKGVYNMPLALTIEGSLDISLLNRTCHYLLQRHESLRTTFEKREHDIVQRVWPAAQLPFAVDYRDYSEYPDSESQVKEDIAQLIIQPFDLSVFPLIRVYVRKISEQSYVLLIVLHHIVADGVAVEILYNEMLSVYDALLNDRIPVLPALPIQFRDYAAWQSDEIGRDSRLRDFWLQRFVGELPLLEIPSDRPRPLVQTFNGSNERIMIDSHVARELRELSMRNNVSLYVVLLAAVKAMLFRYTGQEDIIVGCPVTGREHPDLEHQIGLFINTLPLRTECLAKDTFLSLVDKVKETTISAFDHQQYPFDKLVDELGLQRDTSRSPLFDVAVALQQEETIAAQEEHDARLQISRYGLSAGGSKFDLLFYFSESDAGIWLSINYNTDLFDRSRIQQMGMHLHQVMNTVVAKADTQIGSIPLLTAQEQTAILHYGAMQEQQQAEGIITCFDREAAFHADKIAIYCKGQHWTYRQLMHDADQLALCLKTKYASQLKVPVAILFGRSYEMIVSILAILKSGTAYVPLDPAAPASRNEFIVQDAGCLLILTGEQQVTAEWDLPEAVSVCSPGACRDDISVISTGMLSLRPCFPFDPAYIAYTSGSTGTPKGILVEHKSVVRLVKDTNYVTFHADDRVLQLSNYVFDGAVFDIFGALLNGATLYIPTEEILSSDKMLADYITDHAISITFMTTALLNTLADVQPQCLAGLDKVFFGGEQVSVSHVRKLLPFRKNEAVFVHVYGPTENTTFSTFYEIRQLPADAVTIPIGRPLSGTSAFILDAAMQLVPQGVIGEICLGGTGLAREYVNNPALTRSKFVRSNLVTEGLLYRTGDLGYWDAQGNIVFKGRIDRQVKIRGHRVEPREIEQVLTGTGKIREAFVTDYRDADQVIALAAYYTADQAVEPALLRSQLEGSLPGYMMPAVFIYLDHLPLNRNGKIDRAALPAPQPAGDSRQEDIIAPSTTRERQMLGIWQEVLGRDRISVADNFFWLGGHSLLAMRMLGMIRQVLGAELNIRDVFLHPSISQLCARIDQLTDTTVLPPVTRMERPALIPLSFAQERLWFIDQLQGSTQYHMPVLLQLEGDVDIAALTQAFRQLVNRHEVLRTVIKAVNGQPYQQVMGTDGFELVNYTEECSGDALSLRVAAEISQPFDLAEDHMIRAALFCTGDSSWLLLIQVHHIVSDGWSMGILEKELSALYAAATIGEDAGLPALEVQYADYALWQRSCYSSEVLARKLAFWERQLRDVTPLELPSDYARPAVQSLRGAVTACVIDRSLTDRLLQLSLEEDVTLFMTLLAAFNVLLHRYSGQHDITVGAPVSNRQQLTLEPLIGFFVNTLVLRSNLEGNPSFRNFLQQVKHTTVDAYQHQDVPFEKIVETLVRDRDLSRSPLFQVMLVLQNTLGDAADNAGDTTDVNIRSSSYEHTTAQFDLSLNIAETAEGLAINAEYCTDLYSRGTIDRLLVHYMQLLQAIVVNADLPLHELAMLTSDELQELLHTYNDTVVAHAQGNIVRLFDEQVLLRASYPAVVMEDEVLSYEDLNREANKLAHLLAVRDAGPGSLVAVCVPRSPRLIIAILAILKAGAAYVPVDPDLPEDRIRYMLTDSGAQLLLTTSTTKLPDGLSFGRQVLLMDRDGYQAALGDDNPGMDIHPGSLAYVIYTSGSTGRPKGAMIAHHCIYNMSMAWRNHYQLNEQPPVLLSVASVSFDVFTGDICRALLNGGTLLLAPASQRFDVGYLCDTINRHQVTILESTPGLVVQLIRYAQDEMIDFPSLKILIAGSDICSVADYQYLYDYCHPAIRLLNSYGITETTVDISYFEGPLYENAIVPIGRPMDNITCYILDEYQQLLPAGIPGELYIGGAGVGIGYVNDDALSAQRFITHRLGDQENIRLYRTGDKARWLPGGMLECLGRIDQQVKIRGYRVEPGEVETVLQQCKGVRQGVVDVMEDNAGTKLLVGYVVPDITYDRDEVIAGLSAVLPDYMVPALWMTLDSLPLNINGKVDRKALPQPDMTAMHSQDYAAPVNKMQEMLVAIWETVLDVRPIGIRDNFFAMGGHSLKAIKLMSAIRKEMNMQMQLADIFRHPTIETLAAVIKIDSHQHYTPIAIVPEQPHYVLSYAQKRLWVLHKIERQLYHYNFPYAYTIKGTLNVPALQNAFLGMVNRHEILRTVIVEVDNEPRQQVLSPADTVFAMSNVDLSATPANYEVAQRMIEKETYYVFDLAAAPLVRAILYHLGEDEYLLFINLHHIIFDGWSMDMFMDELYQLYDISVAGEQSALPELKIQYKDYAAWQHTMLEGAALQALENYWLQQVFRKPYTLLELPVDYRRPADRTYQAAQFNIQLTATCHENMKRSNEQYGTSMFMQVLSCYYALLYRCSGQTDMVVGTPVAGRDHPDLYGQVGFYINMLPLRISFSGEDTFDDLLMKVKESCLGAFDNQLYPFDMLVDKLKVKRELGRSTLFDAGITWDAAHTRPDDIVYEPSGDLEIIPFGTGFNVIKGDLWIYGAENNGDLQLVLQYSTELFSEERMQLMKERFLLFMERLDMNRHLRICDIWNDIEQQINPVTSDEEFTLEINL